MAVYGMLMAALVGWGISPPAAAQIPGSAGGSPAVLFPEKIFEFPPVIDGAQVVHDFVVFNKGTVPLLIDNVRTG
jgi:hypothetical protein